MPDVWLFYAGVWLSPNLICALSKILQGYDTYMVDYTYTKNVNIFHFSLVGRGSTNAFVSTEEEGGLGAL